MPGGLAFALIPSPLVGSSTFEPLRAELARRGTNASIVPGALPEGPPYWATWAMSIAATLPASNRVVLVAHSGAAPVADLVANASPDVAAVVYLDGTLLAPGSSFLDTFDSAKLDAEPFRSAIARGVWPNPWSSPDLWEQVGIPHEDAVRFAAEARELPVARNAEALPEAAANVAHGYIAFVPNAFYAPMLAGCRESGWPVRELPGMHFHFLVAPQAVAAALLDILSDLGVAA
jgi:hypothetical protein